MKKTVTIIELIILMVIIGIFAVTVLPNFEIFNYIKLEGAVRRVVADIRFVQSIACAEHQDYAIYFDPVADVYQAYRVVDKKPLVSPFTRQDLVVDFKNSSHYKGIDIYEVDLGGTEVLRFNWQGVPLNEEGEEFTRAGKVQLRYSQSKRTIWITPYTGRIDAQ